MTFSDIYIHRLKPWNLIRVQKSVFNQIWGVFHPQEASFLNMTTDLISLALEWNPKSNPSFSDVFSSHHFAEKPLIGTGRSFPVDRWASQIIVPKDEHHFAKNCCFFTQNLWKDLFVQRRRLVKAMNTSNILNNRWFHHFGIQNKQILSAIETCQSLLRSSRSRTCLRKCLRTGWGCSGAAARFLGVGFRSELMKRGKH